MGQYTPKNCAAVQRAFTQLLDALIKTGADASTEVKLTFFDEVMLKLNRLNERDPDLFESEERDQLCAQLEEIATVANINFTKDADGESRITSGRDW